MEYPLTTFGMKVVHKGRRHLGPATVVGFRMAGFDVDSDGITPNPSACYGEGEYSLKVLWDKYPHEFAISRPDEFEVFVEPARPLRSCDLPPQPGDDKKVGDSNVTWGEVFGRARGANVSKELVVGENISDAAYLACIEAIKAHESPRQACARLNITPEQWRQVGVLAFGGDGFNHHLHQIALRLET